MCVEVTENRVLFTASAFKTHNVVNIAPNTVICITLRSNFKHQTALYSTTLFSKKKRSLCGAVARITWPGVKDIGLE